MDSDMEWSALRLNFHALKRYNADLLKQVEDLTEELERVRSWARGVEVDNDLVRKERDEARVTLCIEVAETNCDFRKVVSSPAQVASEYGWDYLIADFGDDDHGMGICDLEFAHEVCGDDEDAAVEYYEQLTRRHNDLPDEPRAEND